MTRHGFGRHLRAELVRMITLERSPGVIIDVKGQGGAAPGRLLGGRLLSRRRQPPRLDGSAIRDHYGAWPYVASSHGAWTRGAEEPTFLRVQDPDPHASERLAFGANVRLIRKEAGWSQEYLAGVAGLARAYVGHVENGRRNVSLHTMWQLANALGVTPAAFFREGQSVAQPTASANSRASDFEASPGGRGTSNARTS